MTLLGVLRQCKLTTAAVGAGLLLFPLTSVLATTAPIIALVGDKELASPVQHGISRLTQALQTKGAVVEEAESLPQANAKTVLVFGIGAGNGETAKLISELKLAPLQAAESLCVRRISRDGKAVLLVAGADARGLMYALLDIADRVRWTTPADSPFTEVRDIEEKPYAAERALSLYTFNRTYWESRFYDEAYWARYLDVLAQNRFNSLVVILGYENGGFLAPCYPDFFDVEGFPDVRMMGITPAQQQRNLSSMRCPYSTAFSSACTTNPA